tara:strand:- start:18 stop:473 length:456 start_codon:yes stop_codon:yes gene_type:complete
MTKVKTTTIPSPRVIMLSNNQQVIAGMTVEEGSDFVRLHEPYKIRIHENAVDDKTYFVEERMSLTPWTFQTIDKVYSLHKTHIMTIGKPNDNLTEYYNNVRMGLYPSMKKEIQPLHSKGQSDKPFEQVLDEMSDEDYYQTIQYLRGKIKSH